MSVINGNSTTTFTTPKAATTNTSSANSNGAGSPSVITEQNSLDSTFSDFLTMLTTQLKNQDPTSPMDTSQFTSQLVSFSQVEQQLKSNADLDKLVASSNNNQTSLGLSYIGLDVSSTGSKFDFNPATVSGVTLGYNLSAPAATNKISIVDSSGNVVYSTNGSLTQGQNSFTWDGSDQITGAAAPAGTYSIQVSAADAKSAAVAATTQVPGYVSGIQTASDGTIELVVGSQLIPVTSVVSAGVPQTASNTSNNSTATN